MKHNYTFAAKANVVYVLCMTGEYIMDEGCVFLPDHFFLFELLLNFNIFYQLNTIKMLRLTGARHTVK